MAAASYGQNEPLRDVIEFLPNTPVQLAIKYPQPKIVQGRFGERAMFSLIDGRVAFVDLAVAEQIVGAAVRTGEPFWVCKKWDGKRTSTPVWSVWLDGATEKTRAAEEHPDAFAASRAGINRAVERTFGPQSNGTFEVPATPKALPASTSQALPATELEWQLRKSAEVQQLKRKLGVDSAAAATLETPWAAQIKQRTMANLELYWDLCREAQKRFPGMTKREVSKLPHERADQRGAGQTVNNHQLRRWLMKEVHGIEIPRKSPRRAVGGPPRSYTYRAWIRQPTLRGLWPRAMR
jgi:hypothetical protein